MKNFYTLYIGGLDCWAWFIIHGELTTSKIMTSAISQIELSPQQVNNLIARYHAAIEPYVKELVKIKSLVDFQIILHQDGRIERIDRPTEDQAKYIKLLEEGIELERDRLQKQIARG